MKKKNRKENKFVQWFDMISNGLENGVTILGKMTTTSAGKSIINIMVKILTILIFTALLEIPFRLVRVLANVLFSWNPSTITYFLGRYFDIFCRYSYLVMAVVLIVFLIHRLILKDHSKEDLSKEVLTPVWKFLLSVLKVLSIPLGLLLMVLLFCFILMVVGVFVHIYSIGLFVVLLGLLLMIFSLLWFCKEEA